MQDELLVTDIGDAEDFVLDLGDDLAIEVAIVAGEPTAAFLTLRGRAVLELRGGEA